MEYSLKPASEIDKVWLDNLRREAYRDLFVVTWGGWDEVRHREHFAKTWEAGSISIIVVGELPVGMIQLLEADDEVEIAEIQILPDQQVHRLGTRVLEDVIDSARMKNKRVSLYLGLKNLGAFRVYERLGFQERC